MMRTLAEQGFRVSLWQWPNMLVGSSMYLEARGKGYLVRRNTGRAYTYSGFEDDAGLLDYSNPATVEWIEAKLRELFELGAAVIKADFGEGAPPDGVYHDAEGHEIHNLYPLLYGRAVFEATREARGEGILWGRSAWAGSQRYPVHWSGDSLARREDLACVLRSALSFGLSGFPFYSHDIGGFLGVPDPDVYVRWAQLGLFASHARCHGFPPREPWAYGERAEAIFRRYGELRYRLLPYIYSEAVECVRSSTPMMRALVLDFQDDPTTYAIDDEYLFGRSILVAPILDATESRGVYLPRGAWVDLRSFEKLEGGRWIDVDAPLDVLPMYARAGAIIPSGPVMQHVGERRSDPLTLDLYHPGDTGTYTVHDEAGPDVDVAYRASGRELVVTVHGAAASLELRVHGADVVQARAGEARLEAEALEHAGGVVRLPAGPALEVTLELSRT
jgi:alpha-D-xyloside xylohydrolase